MPIHDEIFSREDKQLTCGGAALNSSRACNHVLQKHNHDGKVCFFGCVANDEAGKILKDKLKEVGMVDKFAITDEIATGRCAVVVHEKERTLCANIGACAKYPTRHFEEHIVSFRRQKLTLLMCVCECRMCSEMLGLFTRLGSLLRRTVRC